MSPRSMASSATDAAVIPADPSRVANKLLAQASPEFPPQYPSEGHQLAHQAALTQPRPESESYDPTQGVLKLPIPETAQNGDAEAQFDLGVSYDRGDGVERDATQAFKWYREAAEQGLAKAQFKLAVFYFKGDGVAKNDGQAVKWFRRSAEQGIVTAQYNLGGFYEKGIGVSPDIESAVQWYRKSAEQGLPESQYMLGAKYGLGDGLPLNMIESFRWIRYAANQGHAESQWLIASFYHGGLGVCKDYLEAYKWALLARSNQSELSQECENLLTSVQKYLNKQQIRHCEIAASRWEVKEWDQIKPFLRNPERIETPDGPRYRLSAPIQAVKKLLDRWQISPEHTAQFMGFGQSDRRYVEGLLTGHEILIQGSEAEDRIVNLYYIRCVLGAMLRDKDDENRWLRMSDPKLGGKSLMDLILSGRRTGLLEARDHVDWVSGRLGC